MKQNAMKLTVAAVAFAALTICLIPTSSLAQSSRWDELANLPFPGGVPTQESADALHAELAFQRAVQAYLWSLPAMNVYAMREGQRKAFDDDSNTLMISKDRIDYRLEYTTGTVRAPNSTPGRSARISTR